MSAWSCVFRFSKRGRLGLEGGKGSQGQFGLLYLPGCVALLGFLGSDWTEAYGYERHGLLAMVAEANATDAW